MKNIFILAALCGALSLPAINLSAADLDRVQNLDRDRERFQEQLYGSQMMTEQERAEHHARMHSAETWEERDRIRKEHHERMEKRAKELGIDLPDEPMSGRGSMGQGYGGMGSGGMGSGGGRK